MLCFSFSALRMHYCTVFPVKPATRKPRYIDCHVYSLYRQTYASIAYTVAINTCWIIFYKESRSNHKQMIYVHKKVQNWLIIPPLMRNHSFALKMKVPSSTITIMPYRMSQENVYIYHTCLLLNQTNDFSHYNPNFLGKLDIDKNNS